MLQEEPYSNHNSVDDERTERNIFSTKLVNVTGRESHVPGHARGRGRVRRREREGGRVQSEVWRIHGEEIGRRLPLRSPQQDDKGHDRRQRWF